MPGTRPTTPPGSPSTADHGPPITRCVVCGKQVAPDELIVVRTSLGRRTTTLAAEDRAPAEAGVRSHADCVA